MFYPRTAPAPGEEADLLKGTGMGTDTKWIKRGICPECIHDMHDCADGQFCPECGFFTERKFERTGQ